MHLLYNVDTPKPKSGEIIIDQDVYNLENPLFSAVPGV